MNLNTATLDELRTLKVIGCSRAYDLAAWRPFHSWSDVACVPGIGEARMILLRAAAQNETTREPSRRSQVVGK
jgi:DNA uptake protein ComE-like DNA-binding protein